MHALFFWEIAHVKIWALKSNFQASPWPLTIRWYWERTEDMSRNSSIATSCSSFKTSLFNVFQYLVLILVKYILECVALKFWLKGHQRERVKLQPLVQSSIKELVKINFRFKHAPPSSQDHSRFLLHISLPQDQPSLVNQGKQALPVWWESHGISQGETFQVFCR